MCGICGVAFTDPNAQSDAGELEAMTATLQHRGPDSHGFLRSSGAALGFRRLAIIDLDTGDQPISNEDGSIALVCNGEIYNFVELRRDLEARGHRFRSQSDVETILHLYEEHGPGCVAHLRGMFAFALWDSRQKRLMLARDRFGIKPLHYAPLPDRIAFASEQKAILAGRHCLDYRPEPEAIRDLLELGFVAGTKTLVRGIHRLAPGHYLLYQRGHVSLHQYWDVSFPPDAGSRKSPNASEWAEALLDKLAESVRLHLRSDVPVGAWLSSGIDSSAVVALACGFTKEKIRSVTLAFDDPALDETGRFRSLDTYPEFPVSNERIHCGDDFALYPKALWHCEEPTGIMIPRMILSEAAAKTRKVVLTGEGADEVFGGYHWYRHERALRPLARLPLWMRRLLVRPMAALPRWNWKMNQLLLAPPAMGWERYRAMHAPAFGSLEAQLLSLELYGELPPSEERPLPVILPDAFDSWNTFQKLQYLDMKIRLPEFVNHSLDRASMAFGLEARVPFLDHQLVEFCSRIPVSLKMRGLEEKYILRKAVEHTLPREIVARRKHPLGAPNASWWRKELPEFAREALSTERLQAAGFFQPAFVRQMLESHRHGQGSYQMYLSAVLAVQLRFAGR